MNCKADILFLDIDGVLVTTSGRMPGEAISALIKLIDDQTKVVIHSTIRVDNKRLAAIEEYLSQNDIRVDSTTSEHIPSKALAINDWLINEYAESLDSLPEMIVVIDDEAGSEWRPEWCSASRFRIITPDRKVGLKMIDVMENDHE